MISIEDSIPSKSPSFLKGVSILFGSFNDVDFYVEDEGKENFYYLIFRKLFPEMKITKIFPLGGKQYVIQEAAKHTGNLKKVFIADKDFDDLLGKIVVLPNLFYLQRYSIENYLPSEETIIEYVIGESPAMRRDQVKETLSFNSRLHAASLLFHELTVLFILIQYWNLSYDNTSIAPERFFKLANDEVKNEEYLRYKHGLESDLRARDGRVKMNSQVGKIRSKFKLNSWSDTECHIPGKYVVKYFKFNIERLFNLTQRNIDSFCYHLAKGNDFANLEFLKTGVSNYISQ